MTGRRIIIIAGFFGILAVALGAFGAHALKAKLTALDLLGTYQTAVQYHFYHTLALLLVGFISLNDTHSKFLLRSAWLFAVGIVLFSGSLYALCFTGLTIFGPVTPVGGFAFILGWLFLTIYGIKKASA